MKLFDAIDRLDSEAIVELLAPLSEPERSALDRRVAVLAEKLYARERDAGVNATYEDHRRVDAAFLAWVGVGTPKTWPRGVDIHDGPQRMRLQDAFSSPAGHRVLADRRPEWLSELADEYLTFGHGLWDAVWRLVVDGLIPRPDNPAYLAGLAEYAGKSQQEPVAAMVKRDPALLAVELPAFLDRHGLADLVRHDDRRHDTPFRPALPVRVWSPLLTPDEPLRGRVLTGVLDALAGDAAGRDAPAYQKFLESLNPDLDELAERRLLLLRMAGHPLPSVVWYAVLKLAKLDKAGHLDPSDVVEHLAPATTASSARTAVAAVQLIAAALHRQPALADAAAGHLTPALGHTSADVQMAVVKTLLEYASDAEVMAVLTDALPDLAPTVAAELGVSMPSHDPGLAGLLTDPRLPADVLAAARAGEEPPPVVVGPHPGGSGPVTAITTLDSLVEELLRVLDRTGRTSMTMERALDGLAALGGPRPADFGHRVGPVIARANAFFDADDPPRWGESITGDFAFLVASWTDPPRTLASDQLLDEPRDWLMGRISEVASARKRGTSARLLALPTDAEGWIDPVVLADRVLAVGDEALDRPLDVAIAIGRLTPWDRAAARERLAGASGRLAAVIRAACGSPEKPPADLPYVVRRAVQWVRGGPYEGPPYRFGDPVPAPPEEVSYPREVHGKARWVPTADGGIFADFTHLPEYQEWSRWQSHTSTARYSTGWAASQWPGDTRWVWESAAHSRRVLSWLLDPREPLTAAALRAVIRHLADGSARVRARATDVLTASIGDGRLTSAGLGAALLSEWSSRFVEPLTLVAGSSPLHRAVVRRALVASAGSWLTLPSRPLCTLLDLLDQLCAADRTGIAGGRARALLAGRQAGRTKTATLIRRLLAHPPGEDWPAAAAAQALRARIARQWPRELA
ncbi:hypothetical protein HH310_10900 [Actinoplanes sp. TBRC 11911]|uniref:DUF6493 family protein n=1 Tax=Actinoplanes sp. TBRC 11911 TaxID=2729386 RepID=UPI00145DBDD6|nr:DUF6493 family protein [Actinoplanes sp. TBRC 11911]NMO51697.1 hypothetical protein [Actinoplanes sp. TBRC 11911]